MGDFDVGPPSRKGVPLRDGSGGPGAGPGRALGGLWRAGWGGPWRGDVSRDSGKGSVERGHQQSVTSLCSRVSQGGFLTHRTRIWPWLFSTTTPLGPLGETEAKTGLGRRPEGSRGAGEVAGESQPRLASLEQLPGRVRHRTLFSQAVLAISGWEGRPGPRLRPTRTARIR